MNNKLIAPIIIIVILVGLVTSVLAITNYGVVQNDKVTAKDVVYGSSSDLPYVASSFKIYKGWNLIPSPGQGIQAPARSPDNYFGYSSEMGCGNKRNDFSGYQIKYGYIYVPGEGYIGGKIDYNSNGFESSVQQKADNAIRNYYLSSEMGGNDGIWSVYTTSRWVYSDMECQYPLAQLEVRDVDKIYSDGLKKTKLSQGWNLIFLSAGFYDKTLNEVVGDCKITSVNQWDPINQKWQYTSSEAQEQANQLLNTKIDINYLYMPLAVKVSATCTLGQSITTPPTIPN
ncbi:hypothetical protein J4234_02795 [Candidatus Woesearchaeota archaeon]|nr:hypothetical protein [Candidatus Woesearchaeota archaeon]